MNSELYRLLEIVARKWKPKEQSYEGRGASKSIIENRPRTVAKRIRQRNSSRESVDELVRTNRFEHIAPSFQMYLKIRLKKKDEDFIFLVERGYDEVKLMHSLVFQASGFYAQGDEHENIYLNHIYDPDDRPNFDYFDAAVVAYKLVRARSRFEEGASELSIKVVEAAIPVLYCAIDMEGEVCNLLKDPVSYRLQRMGSIDLGKEQQGHLKRLDLIRNENLLRR